MTTKKREASSNPDDDKENSPLVGLDSAVFKTVNVKLDANLGSVSLSVRELLALKTGQLITLDSRLNDLVEIRLNGNLVGRGEIVAVNDSFGVRIVEIAGAT
ncbi:FliM/FliN family flagellar motor switch protein [Brevundimonas sp.]|jgi:flagellar motor switch protein FliN/FliY|uniref:FliM/FliN family flagellar motor switch protein n=1 Tax=Brevundimonas sp. TaxID=1871086 RepID=UPI002E0DEFED|nr:FliM/FliN family flagellar motor switch protein [Brevundimonas sp.]